MHNLYIIVSHLVLYNGDYWYDNIYNFLYVMICHNGVCVCYYICFPFVWGHDYPDQLVGWEWQRFWALRDWSLSVLSVMC